MDTLEVIEPADFESWLEQNGGGEASFSRAIPASVQLVLDHGDGERSRGPLLSREAYLKRLNGICRQFGSAFVARFFGHGDAFDATVLRALPDLASLHIHDVKTVVGLDVLNDMRELRELQFGTRDQDPALLERLPLEQLTAFSLLEMGTEKVDLAPLRRARNLRCLRTFAQRKNMEAVAELADLEELVLHPSKTMSLAVLNGMPSLRALRLLLGSCESIVDLRDLPALEELSITRVRFLSQTGDLQRFPSLQVLSLSDQIRIERIKTGLKNPSLKHIWLQNLPNLEPIIGLMALPGLQSLAAIKTGLALDQIDTPSSLTHLFLHTGRLKDVDAIKDEVEMRGLAYAYYPGLHIAEK